MVIFQSASPENRNESFGKALREFVAVGLGKTIKTLDFRQIEGSRLAQDDCRMASLLIGDLKAMIVP